MKKLMVITGPYFFKGETEIINQLFEQGLERLHVRKPSATEKELEDFLLQIPAQWYPFMVLHDHFELMQSYPLGGVHLNGRHPGVSFPVKGTISRSCHSWKEIQDNQQLDYLFLSPIFESLSKKGYGGDRFTSDELLSASENHLINSRVMALGGISLKTLPLLQHLSFGGYAVIGAVWGESPEDEPEKVLNRFKQLQTWIQKEMI